MKLFATIDGRIINEFQIKEKREIHPDSKKIIDEYEIRQYSSGGEDNTTSDSISVSPSYDFVIPWWCEDPNYAYFSDRKTNLTFSNVRHWMFLARAEYLEDKFSKKRVIKDLVAKIDPKNEINFSMISGTHEEFERNNTIMSKNIDKYLQEANNKEYEILTRNEK